VARNILAENPSVTKAQQTSIYVLGWGAQGLSIIAGSYAVNSWPGKTIRWILDLMPGHWLIPLMLVIGFVVWAIDIINDLTPNQGAIMFGFMGPVLAGSHDASGSLAAHIRDWSQTLQHGVGGQLSGWVGNLSAGWLAVALIVVAVIIGRRVLQKQSAGSGRGAGGGGGR
jgi:hypothetical protein